MLQVFLIYKYSPQLSVKHSALNESLLEPSQDNLHRHKNEISVIKENTKIL